jgi:hypothetical protein
MELAANGALPGDAVSRGERQFTIIVVAVSSRAEAGIR